MPNWLIRSSLCWFILFCSTVHSLTNDQLKRYEIIYFQIKPTFDPNMQPSINQAFIEIKGKLLLVEINAFEQYFRLVALAGEQLKVRIFQNGNQYATHLNESYFVGYLMDRPGHSKVMGYLTNQRFIGLIYDRNQVFHIDLLRNGNQVIMYRESDVIVEHGKASQPVESRDFDRLNRLGKLSSQMSNLSSPVSINQPKQTDVHQHEQPTKFKQNTNLRYRRSMRTKSKRFGSTVLYSKRPIACHVELIADHSFAGRYNYDTNLIANEMHLQLMKANEIYQNTDFNHDGLPEGISLRTASIIIFKDENATGYTYSNLALTPMEILHAFSKRIQNHCLAFTFLYRDFSIFPQFKGTLGLAWLSTPENHAGICSQPAINREISSNSIVISNVGLLTTWFRGKERPRAEVAQTLAHEIGHLFGARHDDGPDLKSIHPDWNCPSKYLMSATASFGTTATIFTYCSTWQINAVLAVKSACFRELKAFCGNGQIEEGEECDCGPPEMCEKAQDRCCVPSTCLIREECKQEFRSPDTNENEVQLPTLAYDPNLAAISPYQQPYHPLPDTTPNIRLENVPPNNVPSNNIPNHIPSGDDQPNGPFYIANQPIMAYPDDDHLKSNNRRPKVFNPKTKKPVPDDDYEEAETNRSNKFNAFFDQLGELNWPQISLFFLVILVLGLFLIFCRDTWSKNDFDPEQMIERRRKRKYLKRKRYHRRLEEESDED